MIILKPPTFNARDKQHWAHILCCGNFTELHTFAAQWGVDKRYFDDKYAVECLLLDGHWKVQGTVQLRGAYWITPDLHKRLEKLCVARLWMGKSRKWELYEYGNYSDPTGLNFIPQRNPPVREQTGVLCGYANQPDPTLIQQNIAAWQADPARERLNASIDAWIADNLGKDEKLTVKEKINEDYHEPIRTDNLLEEAFTG